ncbi:MAG: PA2778 family cysteine peptidase [Gammaproteobacteria bacterium]
MAEDPRYELTTVPFFPQTIHQCGPAALATVLGATGIAVEPEALAPEVYLPGRRGSLQVEMLATARRHGRLAYVIEPRIETLLAEISAGNPVLVLQDLGALGIRRWHYAAVVGFDPVSDVLVLRSGKDRRHVVRRERFLRTWQASDNWGVVVSRADTPPATAAASGYVPTLLAAEPYLPAADIDAAYTMMLARWPADPLVRFAAGNHAYGSGHLAEAINDYRTLLKVDPVHIAGLNNLANALLDSGCAVDALAKPGVQKSWLILLPLATAVADTLDKALAATTSVSATEGTGDSVCTAE